MSEHPNINPDPGGEEFFRLNLPQQGAFKAEPYDDDLPPTALPPPPTPVQRAEPTPEHEAAPAIDDPLSHELTYLEDHHDLKHLEGLRSAEDLDLLEAGVRVGRQVLKAMKPALEEALVHGEQTQASHWLTGISNAEGRAKQNRTVVGVVGTTGAGKSSVINALVDEERLLPTNCMRACTASATEISYNFSDNPSELYRAEIEFITVEDWTKELRIICDELLGGSGNVARDAVSRDTEAGVAYDLIKAVYPHKTKEMISQSDPEHLANDPKVSKILGTVKKLRDTTASGLYRQLQSFVDSKEKSAGEKGRMEFWPLIKVVKIFTKASALSTGAVIVDLPGVQDANAARAAVAEKYMKECSSLWIVAPINRAVDDKTAKTLLGKTFRRQMKYDGQFAMVTFICTKTDDIPVTETEDSLGIAEETRPWTESAKDSERERDQLTAELKALTDEKEAVAESLETSEFQQEQWEELQEKLDDGETVYAPLSTSSSSKKTKKKRKRDSKASGRRSKRESDLLQDDVSQLLDEDRVPLTEDDIEDKLRAIKSEIKDLRKKRKEINAKISTLEDLIEKANARIKDAQAKIKGACIRGRNQYSREAIRLDFAAGVKELDQEAANEEDEDAFNPDEDARDYNEVAKSLPVFCVSSRSYQKLQGRFERDKIQVDGFEDLQDTEIPQLQEHAKKLTENGRRFECQVFLTDLIQLINSMCIWAANDGTRSNLSEQEKKSQHVRLQKKLEKLGTTLLGSGAGCVEQIEVALNECIYSTFDALIEAASASAFDTAQKWGATKDEGGMLHGTYKATCRRDGVYSGAIGPRDFNAELVDPIHKDLASGWEKAFQRRLPNALKSLAVLIKKTLDDFHTSVAARARTQGASQISLQILSNQLRAHQVTLNGIPQTVQQNITELQRDANRQFTPVVAAMMKAAYTACINESGPGSFRRMKDIMTGHVERAGHIMFGNAMHTVRQRLEELTKIVKETLDIEIDQTYQKIYRDYMQSLGGGHGSNLLLASRHERMLRHAMSQLLQGVDGEFANITPDSARDEQPVGIPDVGRLDGDGALADAYDDSFDPFATDDEGNGTFEDADDDETIRNQQPAADSLNSQGSGLSESSSAGNRLSAKPAPKKNAPAPALPDDED